MHIQTYALIWIRHRRLIAGTVAEAVVPAWDSNCYRWSSKLVWNADNDRQHFKV